jgi:energy-coupling factor transporter ATP-binding protein EcfA2
MGELIGISGPIGSGKSTVAACLSTVQPSHAHYETWYVVAEIATAFNQALKAELAYETTNNPIDLANQVLIWLPEAISEQLHHDVTWNQLAFSKHDALAKPELFEKLLAYLELVDKNPKLLDTTLNPDTKEQFRTLLQWIGNYLIVKLSKTIWYDELFRRIDMRDPTTSLVVISGVRYPSDAEMIRQRGGRVMTVERPNHATESTDPTESQRSDIKPDFRLINNGSKEQLQTVVESLWDDIAAGRLKPIYTAA